MGRADRTNEAQTLRSFLLGALPPRTAGELERRLLADRRLFELAGAVEGELLADYAHGRLAAESVAGVERLLAGSATARRRLGFFAALGRAAAEERRIPAPLAHLDGAALCAALCEASRELRFTDPPEMLRLARLADEIAAAGGPDMTAGLALRAAIELANAYRVCDLLVEAQQAMARAEALLSAPTEPRLRAQFLTIEGSLLGDLRHFAPCLASFRQARAIYEELGDRHGVGGELIKEGLFLDYSGQSEEALALLERGLEHLDPESDPMTYLAGQHARVGVLIRLGAYDEAQHLLDGCRPLFELHYPPLGRLKLRWVEAMLLAGRNELTAAAARFSEVRQSFLAHGQPYCAALVALDLGWVLLRQGQSGQATEVVLAAAQQFRALKIPREALAAVLLLERACAAQLCSAALLRQVADRLAIAQHDLADV